MPEVRENEAAIGALLDAQDLEGAATAAIKLYGPEILGYLIAVLRDEDLARDVFSSVCEEMWKELGDFRRESTFRVWIYKRAWHAALRTRRDPYRRRRHRLSSTGAARLAQEVQSSGVERRAAEVERLRQALSPEEQSLLILRIDRGLQWKEIAVVVGGEVTEASLRKRFERIKERLRSMVEDA